MGKARIPELEGKVKELEVKLVEKDIRIMFLQTNYDRLMVSLEMALNLLRGIRDKEGESSEQKRG